MKMIIYRLSGVLRYCLSQFLDRCAFDALDALEVLEQIGLALVAYTGNIIQRRAFQLPRLLLAVELNGEAVRLLLNAPDHGKQGRVLLYADLPSVCCHECTGAMAVILDHTIGRNVDTYLCHSLQSGPYLSGSAVSNAATMKKHQTDS